MIRALEEEFLPICLCVLVLLQHPSHKRCQMYKTLIPIDHVAMKRLKNVIYILISFPSWNLLLQNFRALNGI